MRHLHLPVALTTLFLSGCFLFQEDGSLVSFQVDYALDEQTVEGNLLGGLLGSLLGLPINLEVNLDEETRARDTGPAQHVYLSELELSITPTAESGGDSDDFGFLDSIEIYVESRQAGSSLPRRRIAHRNPVPSGARTLSMQLEDVDLIDYVNEGARLTASVDGHAPLDDVTFDGFLTLTVEVL
jgi:hypothetical protein